MIFHPDPFVHEEATLSIIHIVPIPRITKMNPAKILNIVPNKNALKNLY